MNLSLTVRFSFKISAQESRRKKKEYMDTLERKVETLQSENAQYKKRVDTLEDDNASLLSQLQKLQATIARRGGESTFLTVITLIFYRNVHCKLEDCKNIDSECVFPFRHS